MHQIFHARHLGLESGIERFVYLFGKLQYKLTDKGLELSRPILNRWFVRYSDILSVEKISSEEAKRLVRSYPPFKMQRKQYPGSDSDEDNDPEVAPDRILGLGDDAIYLVLYVSPGEIILRYQNPKKTKFKSSAEFVLLKTRVKKEEVRFLLTPDDMDGFIAALRPKLIR